jgi:hypothetical protein
MTENRGSTCQRLARFVIGALLLATFVRVWASPGMAIETAQAQIPDAGAQRLDLLREVRRTNELLEKLLQALAKDTLKVEVRNFDDMPSAPPDDGGRR